MRRANARAALATVLLLPVVGAASADDLTPRSVTCESAIGGRQHCPTDTSGGVALIAEVGEESCLLGKTWGYDDKGVWVAEGCSAQFVLGQSQASRTEAKEEATGGVLRNFEPYTRLRGQLAVFDDEAEIQDSASWIGARFSTQGGIKFLAHVELGLNLIGGVDPFQAGQRTDSGLLTSEDILDDPPVLGSRLGYVGVDFGAGGEIHVGKDWGQHYAIAGYTTDRWNAFGGQASMAYPGSGDGGVSGTGRADQVLNYRVTLADRVDLGGQLQFSNSTNDEAVDGYAASLQLTIVEGLRIGVAYTQTEIEDFLERGVLGADGDAEYTIFGVSYDSDRFYFGATYSDQQNGDIRQTPILEEGEDLIVPVLFDGQGVEVFTKVAVGDFWITGGYVDYSPDVDVGLLDPEFQTRYFTLGAEWWAFDNAYAYVEFKVDDSTDFLGIEDSNVAVIGIHYQASGRMRHDP